MEDYQDCIKSHYYENWQRESNIYYWDKGPTEKLPHDFRILEFPPTSKRGMWTYATCGMSQNDDNEGVELHIFSSNQDSGLIELLAAVAFYHRNTENLNLNHTVNFGKSWQGNSKCTHGLISLPYLDGPQLEDMIFEDKTVKFYWLIPITRDELEFKKANGIEALEAQFDNTNFNYLDADRQSII
jgi:hypothetical protein